LYAGETGTFPPAVPSPVVEPAVAPPAAAGEVAEPEPAAPAEQLPRPPARERAMQPGTAARPSAGRVGAPVASAGTAVPAAAPASTGQVPVATGAASAAADVVDSLLSAADGARRARRPGDAAAALRRVIDQHPGDQRAPLAAFTLGRLLLEDLHEPGQAAQAYARARALAPRGPLAEHALAREVESWAAAGNTTRAQAAARAYLGEYPDGSRARSVKELSGLP
jgi:TolA-binding protein